jgi:hypothetical protein
VKSRKKKGANAGAGLVSEFASGPELPDCDEGNVAQVAAEVGRNVARKCATVWHRNEHFLHLCFSAFAATEHNA